jgi:hypothetical protein
MEFPFSLLKIVLASTQGFFDLLAIFDVGYHVIPFDDLSIFISQWETSVKMPSVLPIGAAKTNLAFVRFAAFNARHLASCLSRSSGWIAACHPARSFAPSTYPNNPRIDCLRRYWSHQAAPPTLSQE